MTRALIYARASTAEQDTSTAQQITAATAYAAQHGYVVAASFQDDARSGKTTAGRAGLQELLDFVARKPRAADVVLIWDASRLSRDQDDAAILRGQIRKAGYRVEYVGDAGLNIGGREQRIVEALADYRADSFRADLARNVKRGMLSLFSKGAAGLGKPPLGFDVVRDADGLPRLEPNSDMAQVVAAFELRAVGVTLREIHERIPLCQHRDSWKYIFSNPIYAGRVEWGGELAAPIEPPIPPSLWDAVQARRRHLRHPRRVASKYLLSGVLYCGHCGRLMNGSRGRSRQRYEYHYYRCPYPFGPHCRYIPTHVIEAQVTAALLEYFIPQKMTRVYREWRRRKAEDARTGSAADKARRAELRQALEAPTPKAAPAVDVAALCERIRAMLQAGDPQAMTLAVRAVVARVTWTGGRDGRAKVEVIPPDELFSL